MRNKDKSNKPSQVFSDLTLHLRKCEYCRGKDGKEKDIYETFQSAFDTAKFIEEDRDIYLNVYKCPHGNGWHLTKNNATSDFIERKDVMFQNNNIPLASSDGSWEYIKDEFDKNSIFLEESPDKITIELKSKNNHSMPILKIPCEPGMNVSELSGIIMEIIENVNVEKIFGINIQNAFCASMIKNILDGVVNQITIYTENKEKNQLDSYTILIKKSLLKNKRIKRGDKIKIDIIGKLINNKKMWCCNKVLI
jgi:hypothetical protein